VGVVPSQRSSPFSRDTSQLLYLPLAQHATAQPQADQLTLHIRASAGPTDLPQRLSAIAAAIDPSLVIEDVRSASAEQAQAITPVRITVLATAGLGIFAIALAALGVFGLTAFFVAQRIPEIGVRVALGASPPGILRMVLRQALELAAIGLFMGGLGAIALGGVLRSQFVNASPLGPFTLGRLALVFLGVVVLASWLPARRAARVDPMAALRIDA